MESTIDFIKDYLDDADAIGTAGYKGLASFWNPEYKHTMRPLHRNARKRIHDALLSNGLSLDGKSEKHETIIYNGQNLTAKETKKLDKPK